jgi:L-ribulose-5-phosphate 4-epimerase
MKQHGVFAIGANAREALKAAVMCEDAAKSSYLALSMGGGIQLEQSDVDSLYIRYQNVYGQL